MNMHPKPALRHTRYVEPFSAAVIYQSGMPADPYHIRFTRTADGATQLLTMNEDDALQLYLNLAGALRYRDIPTEQIAVAELLDFADDLTELVEHRPPPA
jgi:hypothetical protein